MTAPVIDAHHHFWDPATADYPWLTDDLAAIRRRFGPEDLGPLLAPAGVDATVVVQSRSSEDETVELLATAERVGFVAGVVGWVDLTGPDVAGRIEALRAGCGGRRLAGIRHQVHDEADPRWLAGADVVRGLEAVGEAGLAYDLLVRTRELPAAVEVAAALPEVRFVLDHLAKPPYAGDIREWAAALAPLASLPNVACKLSGMITEIDGNRWTIDDLRESASFVIDQFGPERIMIGSDWPVCLLAADYNQVHGTARALLAGLDERERAAALGGNAIRIYQLEEMT
jgi:L-fuconolactonase